MAMYKNLFMAVVMLLATSGSAALVWTGTGDSISLFNEANWVDDTGSTPAADTINGGTGITADTGDENLVVISSGSGSPSNAGSYLSLGNNSLTISGDKKLGFYDTGDNNGCVIAGWQQSGQVLTVSDGATLVGVDARNFTAVIVDGGTVELSGDFTSGGTGYTDGFSISNGGSVTANRIETDYDETITVDSTSSLTLTTTEIPFARVDLEVGAKLTLSSRAYFTTYGSRIYVDGVSYAEDSSILSFAGDTSAAFAGVTVAPELSIITYNIHGGYGPDDEGTPESNLIAFRDNYMNNEDVICMQEVDGDSDDDCWAVIPDIFTNHPYSFRTINQETDYSFWETPKETSIVILSKYPFVTTDDELIQTDPTYDQWERHAQHVTIQVGEDVVDIFHFHNTYNFNDNDWEYEKSGLVSFRDYVYSELGISSLDEAENLIMLGDFNLLYANVQTILDTPELKYDGRDHICSVPYFTSSGKYATVTGDLSDHPALWASLDVQAPLPNPLTWETAPIALDSSSIYMVATNALDFNGVEYYFANTTVTDGSHDSGWQNSPSYTDTGLSEGTSYSYTVQTRDGSVNVNISTASEALSATTEEGNDAPIADDLSVVVVENGTVAVTLSGSDQEGCTLTYTVVSQPIHGTLVINGALPDLTYIPDTDYTGTDSFTYTVYDGLLTSDVATASIWVGLTPNIIAGYDFDDGTGNATRAVTVHADLVTASDFGVGAGLMDLVSNDGNCLAENTDAEGYFFGTANPISYGGGRSVFGFTDMNNADNLGLAIDNNDYMVFTITPDSGSLMNLTNFTFRTFAKTTNHAAERWALFSSLDGFAEGAQIQVGQTTVAATYVDNVVDLSAEQFQGLTNAVTFRLYIYGGNESYSAATQFDKVIVRGSVAVDEPELFEITDGCTIGIDFGATASTDPSHSWNHISVGGDATTLGLAAGGIVLIEDVTDVDGNIMTGVDFEFSNDSGQIAYDYVTAGINGDGAVINDASVYGDSIISSDASTRIVTAGTDTFTFLFTGLNDGLAYDLSGGYNLDSANFTALWSADGQSATTTSGAAADGVGYISLTDLGTDGSGNLQITVTGVGGTAHITVSALTLIASGPIAGDVEISRDEGASCKVHISELLAACTDPNGLELGVSAVDGISAGGQSVSLSNSWIFYIPAADYTLGDSFGYSITNSLGAGSSAQVIVTLNGASEADSLSLDVVPDAEGNASLVQYGIPGRVVVIDKTTNLVTGVWTAIQTNTFDATGVIEFEESNIPDQQYYRMRLYQE
jgi:endonuclease/exonuclease/phosphatase family metal-dependent hydrolase